MLHSTATADPSRWDDVYFSFPPIGEPFTHEFDCEHLDSVTWERIEGIPDDAPETFEARFLISMKLEVVTR